MAREHNIDTMLRALHYAAPILVIVYFTLARTAATCFLHRPSKNADNRARRLTSIFLLLAVVTTFLAQAISYFAESILLPGTWAPQDCVIYILASVFAYSSLALKLLESSQPVWHPHLGSCMVGFALEITITALQAVARPSINGFDLSRNVLQVARSIFLICFCLCGGWYTLKDRSPNDEANDEAEPLLYGTTNGHSHKTSYGATPDSDSDYDDGYSSDVDSDMDEPEHIKVLKKAQRKRLEESGSWLGYFKEFKIFIPMLWPSKDRFVQACLVAIGLVLVVERFLNVLVPRQLGIITNELTAGHGNGVFPWRSVGIWMILSWLNSHAGIYVIQSLADIPVRQFAYKSIGATSFSHIMNLSMDFHNEKNSGELIRAIDQGQNLVFLLEFVCFEIAPTFIDIIIAFVYVYLLFDIYMSLILVWVGVAYIWIGAKTTGWSVKRRRRFNKAFRNESKIQVEAINNWPTVSHFNRGKYESMKYSTSIEEHNKAEMDFYFMHYIGSSVQTLIMVLGRLAATFLAIYRVSQGAVPVGNFVTLTAYWGAIESPLDRVSWSVRRVTQMLTDSERLLQLFQTKPSVQDAENAVILSVNKGEVEFNDVNFAYDVRKPTLKEVNFVAKPGQTVALVGETGGGKSTIMKLLYRYYDVAGGSILIDGQDIRDVTLDSLRDSFGMVPQDPALFNITVMENVRYARLDATDDEVKDACRAAAIHDKIETFPDGYNATVGERGVKLSGGELQRVSIARAILRQPKIVLLDEATSMIDAETESVIQEAFKHLTASRTTFIIAHRLSTIQHADSILVINDGQIVERGTHDELFRLNRKYAALWSKQLSKDVKDIGTTLHIDDTDDVLIDLNAEGSSGPAGRGESNDGDGDV